MGIDNYEGLGGIMRPIWIENLVVKGYKLFHPMEPDRALSDEECIMYLAEYAQHLERLTNVADGGASQMRSGQTCR